MTIIRGIITAMGTQFTVLDYILLSYNLETLVRLGTYSFFRITFWTFFNIFVSRHHMDINKKSAL